MKLYPSLLLFLFLLAGNAKAQDAHLGFKGGLNAYHINSVNNDNFAKLGLHAGLFAHIHLSEKFALQPELMYSAQGAKFTNTNTKLHLDYINVPVLLQYMFSNGFRIQAGPQLGFLMNAKTINNDVSTNRTDDYNTLDIALSLGMSYVNVSSGLGIDVRYNHGLSQMNKLGSANLSNRGFQIGLFYLLGHKS